MSRKLPPIEGIPAERPLCAWCGRELPMLVHDTRGDGSEWGTITRRVFFGWGGYPPFCTMRHGLMFGIHAHKKGVTR
jgi:hypothetical protein